jgi:catechol 2,3-dioxygenase-like lactoylglutathione lyase family enzyme
MSYIAFATGSFDAVANFYGVQLGFPLVSQWDRPHGRGQRFDLGAGLKLEILDNLREEKPLLLHNPGDRTHVVIEVDDIGAAHRRLPFDAPPPQAVSWGARLFQVRDPDGVPVTFLQWDRAQG